MCHIHSFRKPNNLKEIYNAWDIFINWSLKNGNSHVSFTINIPHNDKDALSAFNNILKLHPISYNDLNKTNKYNDLYQCLFSDMFDFKSYFDTINEFNKLLTWLFITTEENTKGVLHFHGIIAYRNLMDFNKNIKNNILNKLKINYDSIDVVMKNLYTFKDIKNWLQYLHKNKTLIFKPKIEIIEKYHQFACNLFEKPYINNYNLRNNKKDILKEYKENYYPYYMSVEIIDLFMFNPEDKNFLEIKGIIINKNEINENIFIDLILNYFILKKYFLYNDNIYEKIENTLISYIKIGNIKEIVFDGFEKNIIIYFTQNFPCYFENFDFYFLIKVFKNKMENNILKIKNLTTNKIQLDFTYLEFTDGVYNIENNRFIKKQFFKKENIATIKYYKQSYQWIRQNKPANWINGIKNALGENNSEDFTVICLFIASLFQEKNENRKKNFLYIHGQSNTGKTTYLTKILTRYYGIDNVGSVVNTANFKFQDLQNKLLVIMDEFRYTASNSSDFLKLLGGEPLLVPQKYNKDHIVINKLMGLILSNYLIMEKNENVNKALQERLYIIEFLNTINKDCNNINLKLKNEEPNIIIFCNKIYFSFFNKKSNKENKISKININKYFSIKKNE